MKIALGTFALLFACGHASSPAHAPPPPPPSSGSDAAPPVAAAPPEAPQLRLPTYARPLHEDVDLTLDPASEDFKGKITTELDITESKPVIWLNADEITVDEATLKGWVNERVGARYQQLCGVVILSEFPRNAAGKTLKRLMRDEYWKGMEVQI